MFGLNSSRKLLPGPSDAVCVGDDQLAIGVGQVLLEEALIVVGAADSSTTPVEGSIRRTCSWAWKFWATP